MECNKSHEEVPNAPFVGGHCLAATDLGLEDDGEYPLACLSAAFRADIVSSHAGRSQSSNTFLVFEKPLEGRDFLNLSKSSTAIVKYLRSGFSCSRLIPCLVGPALIGSRCNSM